LRPIRGRRSASFGSVVSGNPFPETCPALSFPDSEIRLRVLGWRFPGRASGLDFPVKPGNDTSWLQMRWRRERRSALLPTHQKNIFQKREHLFVYLRLILRHTRTIAALTLGQGTLTTELQPALSELTISYQPLHWRLSVFIGGWFFRSGLKAES
jgi:hypothetical protein